jgi:hypothetical protein
MDRAAEHVGLKYATLRRHLHREGTSFRALLDAEKRRRLDRLIKEFGAKALTRRWVATELNCSTATADVYITRWYGKSLYRMRNGEPHGNTKGVMMGTEWV